MLCVLEKCLRLDETSQFNKRAYQYKLDRVLRAPMNLIMNMVEMILSVNALNWPFSLRGRILRSILKNR